MAQSFRKSEILALAARDGRVEVEGLAEHFGVTLQTIRRDLGELALEGKLSRVHGGAILPPGAVNIGYHERRDLNPAAKAAIARLCASEIPDNSSLMLNLGTSTEAVARELLDHRNLTVVTNNMKAAEILGSNSSFQVIVTGGIMRAGDGGLVGDLAAATIEQFKVDRAVIGTSAIDPDGDLLDFDLQEVSVSRAILRQAREILLVTDRSKLQRTAPIRIASLREIDAIYTDALPDDLDAKCRDWGTRVRLIDDAPAPAGG